MTIALLVEYNGASFYGWQRQKDLITVQGAIEEAFFKITGITAPAIGSGRTDAGVHARGQVVSIRPGEPMKISEKKLLGAFTATLPNDVRVHRVQYLDMRFNARFDAIARQYKYTILSKDHVLERPFAYYLRYPHNFDLLNESAKIFLGKHDFTTYSKVNETTTNNLCDIQICEWERLSDYKYELTIKSDRYIYGMVRALVGAMIACARKKRTLEQLESNLYYRDRVLANSLAPAEGLVFDKVFYHDHFNLFKD